jgi:hypothetical protein
VRPCLKKSKRRRKKDARRELSAEATWYSRSFWKLLYPSQRRTLCTVLGSALLWREI